MKRLISFVFVFMMFLGTVAVADVTTGEQNALRAAKDYLESSPFSYTGLIEQLEYEGYTRAEATYAVDNCGRDWNEQAAKCAEDYLDAMPFSWDGLIEQLEDEGFTHEQAVYGVEQTGYGASRDEAELQINKVDGEPSDDVDTTSSRYENAFVQAFSSSYKEGDELSGLDFLYVENGVVHDFIDTDYGYVWFAFDETGEILQDYVNIIEDFATMRGIYAFDSVDLVLKQYGCKWVKPFAYQDDVIYQTIAKDKGDNYELGCKRLEYCAKYVVYTYKDYYGYDYQLCFYFDSDEKLVFVAYVYDKLYEDAGAFTTLQIGCNGIAVKDLQSRLSELGFYSIAIDGDYGNGTVKAVKAFERANGLEETGIATVELQELIYSGSNARTQMSAGSEEETVNEQFVLPEGLYRSDDTFLCNYMMGNISVMKYELCCYINIGEEIFSATYMPEADVRCEDVIDEAKKSQYNCNSTYIGNNTFHCEVEYTDYIDSDHPKYEISFDLSVLGEKLVLKNLITSEPQGLENFVEGEYSRVD